MKTALVLSTALLLALSIPASAKNDHDNNGNHYGQIKGAPGPLAGAGLPVILIGGGIYWLVRRRKKANSGRLQR
jgi:LPXTG-motif cell wall-anchored protein